MPGRLEELVNRFVDDVVGKARNTTDAEFQDVPSVSPSKVPDIKADDLAAALVRQANAQHAAPPPWVEALQRDLREVIGTVENATLDAGEKAAARAYQADLQKRLGETVEAFDQLRRYVETGRACPDCRESRKVFCQKLLASLDDEGRNSAPINTGEQYATREHAFKAGYFAATRTLANAVQLMQAEYLNGEKRI